MKRWMVIGCAFTLALGFAAGWTVRPAEVQPPVLSAASSMETARDPLEQFRTERQQLRQRQIAQLNELIYGESADAETTSLAKRRLLELMRWSEQETTLEGLLRLREFADVLVTVHMDSINVMVRADALNRQQSAVILDLVMRETGISGGNVKIIPIN